MRHGHRWITGLALAGFLLSRGTRAEDWPQFLGPAANGISSETSLLDKWPFDGPPGLGETHRHDTARRRWRGELARPASPDRKRGDRRVS